MPYNNLKKINFKNGIQATDIDYNFELLNKKQQYNLLTTTGYGIIDGLEIQETDSINKITLLPGNYIDRDGIIKHINERIIKIDPLNPNVIDNKEYEVNNNGEIKLDFIPYDPYGQSYLTYNELSRYSSNSPLIIREIISNKEIKIINIENDIITLPSRYANSKIKVTYSYICDRIDCIIIDDNDIKVLRGTESSSPSIIDLSQYKQHIVLGFIKIKAAYPNELLVIDKRTVKNIYSNQNNDLFLKGINLENIVDGIIYFEEPEIPIKENTLWFDSTYNQLKIWQNDMWQDVNTVRAELIRKVIRWSPEDNPKDLQTYYFLNQKEAEPYIVFLQDQVEIVIDNTPLMHDQFELIYKNNDQSTYQCLGFKLKAPLEKAAYIEVRLYLTAKEEPLNIVYRKYSAYNIENSIIDPKNKFPNGIINIGNDTYTIGEHQLEVYLNGKKLTPKIDFDELTIDSILPIAADVGKASNVFKLYNIDNIEDGSIIAYKITKTIYAYDHINNLIDELERQACFIKNDVEKLETNLITTNEHVELLLQGLSTSIDNMQKTIDTVSDNYISKYDLINKKQLSDDITNGLHNGKINITIEYLQNVITAPISPSDFYILLYVDKENKESHKILIEEKDYTIEFNSNNKTSNIYMKPYLIDDNHILMIQGIKLTAGVGGVA